MTILTLPQSIKFNREVLLDYSPVLIWFIGMTTVPILNWTLGPTSLPFSMSLTVLLQLMAVCPTTTNGGSKSVGTCLGITAHD